MNQPQSASLILDRKIRGHLPVTRFSVSAAGSVMLAVPDADRSRHYRLGRLSLDGSWQESGGFSVETVASWDLSASGDVFTAVANDALYLFSAGEKTRLLRDRRDLYIDVSITAAGDVVAAASSDMLMSAYSVTLVATVGPSAGTKDLPLTLTCSRIAPDGSAVAAGSEDGMVVLLDRDRRVVWEFDLGEPVARVCVSSDGRVIAGTRFGRVAALRDGERLWEATGSGPVAACAESLDGRAVVIARDDDAHTIECLSGEGRILLEYAAPSAVTSLACSADGRYIALSCRDGSLQVIEMQAGVSRAADARGASDLYANALDLAGRGELQDAVKSLLRALDLEPTNIDASRELDETAHTLVREAILAAEESLSRDDFAEAADRLRVAWDHASLAPDLALEIIAARRRAADRMLSRAGELPDEEAADLLGTLLRLDVTNTDARGLLARVETRITERLLLDADEALAAGDPSGAVSLLEQACERSPSDTVRERLIRARCDEALAEGLVLYEAGKYPEAVVRFRKVLSIDPQNPEALKRIEYAEKLTADDALFDRFSKLE